MRDYGFTKDCYHLSPQGYKDLISYHTQKFYHKFLMDDLYVLSANDSTTGSVSSLGNVADSLVLGEAGGEQFATVLSFNTTSMADTTLSKASIFLRRKALTGVNPINGSLLVKMKSGNFGATASIEASDFTDAGDADGTPCLFGSNTANGDWIRLDLPDSILAHITNAAGTQFIISAPAATGGKVVFDNSSDPEFAPVLNLVYYHVAAPSAISQVISSKGFNVYPNPTNGLLTIESGAESITRLEVCNMLGEVVLQPKMTRNTIDISQLETGMYMLNITTKAGISSQRIYKN